MENNAENKGRIDVQSSQNNEEDKTDKNCHSTGDAGFGVDIGEIDKRNYVND